MNTKIFGYTKKSGKHWFNSDAYSDNEIESIKDPTGGTTITLATAIPSPFARIDLAKTAFRNINRTSRLKAETKNGDTIAGTDDEKMVSDVLDLAEIMYNIDNLRGDIRIIPWDREYHLNSLLKSTSENHRRLGESLQLYLHEDKNSYNFNLVKSLYIIEYKHKIIGCTSPATLFFATAGDLAHAQFKLTGQDIMFDNIYKQLYERSPDFQKYIYTLFKANEVLSKNLTVIQEYLDKNLKIIEKIDPQLFQEINEINPDAYYANYLDLETETAGSSIEILGVPLKKRRREELLKQLKTSDFVINSKKYKGDLKPLVLQNELNKNFVYADDMWERNTKVPYIDREKDLEKRWLPGLKIQYPYLTVSDFLEPFLIRLVYPINDELYYDGNLKILQGPTNKSFLLPIKKKFFEFFDSTDLLESGDDKPNIEIVQEKQDAVKVSLRIPISKKGSKEFITFERIYHKSSEVSTNTVDEDNNIGAIIEHQFGLTVFPFIKTKNESTPAYYRVQLIDRDISDQLKSSTYDLKFFGNSSASPIEYRAKKLRSQKLRNFKDDASSQYYVLHDEFDFIQVKNIGPNKAFGIVIPKWPVYRPGSEQFSFAIDFGTTNTHVEYKVGDGIPKPFDISRKDMQIASLFHPTKTTDDFSGTGAFPIKELIEHEFVPEMIGTDSIYKFPQRTVIAESHYLNIETETFALADFNIPFTYELKPEIDRIQSNLKWAKNERGNQKRIEAFFENLILLLRNKVLLNNGNIAQTKLVWFYPSSMKPNRKATLEKTWNTLFEQYFGNSSSLIGINESLAPFYYFKGANKLQGGGYKPVVSIDIGGGTTDVVVFKDNRPLLLTSFKYAANSIFGDGFSEYGSASSNGLIGKYCGYFEDLLLANMLSELLETFGIIKNKNKTDDLNSFFFSIERNSKIKDKKLFSYHTLLSDDDDLKIVFLYFYAGIIYHIANLMKKEGIQLPKHIIFSGTGSKILNIITPDKKILSNFSKLIFEEIYNEQYDQDGITVETEVSMPKEITCKGGLMVNPEDLDIDIKSIKKVLTCVSGHETLQYSLLNDQNKSEIAESVLTFNTFFIQLHSKYNFTDYFNVSNKSLELYKSEMNKHIRDYLDQGLDYNSTMEEYAQQDGEIEESLFFYPLIGTINNLIGQLSQLSSINR